MYRGVKICDMQSQEALHVSPLIISVVSLKRFWICTITTTSRDVEIVSPATF